MAEPAERRLLQQLAESSAADGCACSLKYGGACLQIMQEDSEGYCIYDVIPWRADPRVPVLYFTRYKEVGDVISVANNEFLESIMARSAAGRWITATEHPLTALPTLFIHPCHTQEWLAATRGDWHLWLQYFGRCAGLRI